MVPLACRHVYVKVPGSLGELPRRVGSWKMPLEEGRATMPWMGRELYEKERELGRIPSSLEGFIPRRRKIHHSALRVFLSDHSHPQEEYLDYLWHQIKRLRSSMWIEKHIIRPWTVCFVRPSNPICLF